MSGHIWCFSTTAPFQNFDGNYTRIGQYLGHSHYSYTIPIVRKGYKYLPTVVSSSTIPYGPKLGSSWTQLGPILECCFGIKARTSILWLVYW